MAILPDSTEEFDQGETHILASSLFNSNGLFLSPEEHRSFDSVLQELLSHQNQGINSMRQELASLRDAVDRLVHSMKPFLDRDSYRIIAADRQQRLGLHK